jgi:hypothetical protein
MAVRFNKSVLVSGWIMLSGLAFFNAPALSAVTSLSLFIVGVVVIPALVFIPRAVLLRALASTRRQALRGWRRTAVCRAWV